MFSLLLSWNDFSKRNACKKLSMSRRIIRIFFLKALTYLLAWSLKVPAISFILNSNIFLISQRALWFNCLSDGDAWLLHRGSRPQVGVCLGLGSLCDRQQRVQDVPTARTAARGASSRPGGCSPSVPCPSKCRCSNNHLNHRSREVGLSGGFRKTSSSSSNSNNSGQRRCQPPGGTPLRRPGERPS